MLSRSTFPLVALILWCAEEAGWREVKDANPYAMLGGMGWIRSTWI